MGPSRAAVHVVAIAASLAVATGASAVDITGRWRGRWQQPPTQVTDGTFELTITRQVLNGSGGDSLAGYFDWRCTISPRPCSGREEVLGTLSASHQLDLLGQRLINPDNLALGHYIGSVSQDGALITNGIFTYPGSPVQQGTWSGSKGLLSGFLGVYGDAAGTQCCVGPFTGETTLYLIATTGGWASYGITGVEFRIQVSNPGGYAFSYTPPVGATCSGNPIDDTPENPSDAKGMTLCFSSCQGGSPPMAGNRVSCGTIHVVNNGGAATDLLVMRKNPSTDPTLLCPTFLDCHTRPLPVCMTRTETSLGEEPIAFRASLNRGGCDGSCGALAVERATWSNVKALFR